MGKLIVGNLKMNLLTIVERERYVESFKNELKSRKILDAKIILCAPSLHLEYFVKKLKLKIVSIGGQNLFWEDRGSFTGEVSAPMLKGLGAEFVIIGHSERRKYFGETSIDANVKIKAALKSGISPIYCVGETKDEREAGDAASVIIEQIKEGFADISSVKAASVVIAYEPVWAIGGDAIPSSDEILEIRILLKKVLAETYGIAVAEKIKILYGGSVKASTVKQACLDPKMDGVLVGRESLIPLEFMNIVEILDKN
jgi:triosephosphate isomerase